MTPKLKTKLAFAGFITAVAAGGAVVATGLHSPEATLAQDGGAAVNRAGKADRLAFENLPQAVARSEKTNALTAPLTAAEAARPGPLTTGSVEHVTIDGPDFGDVADTATEPSVAAAPEQVTTVSVQPATIDGPDFGDVEDAASEPAVATVPADDAKPAGRRNAPRRITVAAPDGGPMLIIPENAGSAETDGSAIVPSRAAPAQRSTNILAEPEGTGGVTKRLWD